MLVMGLFVHMLHDIFHAFYIPTNCIIGSSVIDTWQCVGALTSVSAL